MYDKRKKEMIRDDVRFGQMKLHGIADPQRLAELLQRFFNQRPGVISVYHFGSTAEKGKGRDLDIAVFCSKELDEFRLGSELERFLFENGVIPIARRRVMYYN